MKKIDKGFCLSYSSLSYRRKLIRTVWMGSVMFPAVFLFISEENLMFGVRRNVWVFVLFFMFCIQVFINFRNWKAEERKGKEEEEGS